MNVHNVDMTLPSGTQVVSRVGAVLRAVSSSMPGGLGTSDVARIAGLARPTAHRLLASLAGEGFIDHDHRAGRWHLGPELYLMGSVAAERYDITSVARDSVRALAAETGESAFLSALRGNETVCLVREEGSFPVRSFVLSEGVRFPLGVASAGLVILAFMSDSEIERHLAKTNLPARFGQHHADEEVWQRITSARTTGYAVNPGLLVEGSWGMGAAIFDSSGQPAWALSLTGIELRFSPDRQPELGKRLLEHAHRVSQRLVSQPPARG
ncbi:IclR family transcriptional regulator [Salinibacterium sp. ZJ454]|uniref:IclR family transcriptional regulator n=1 Tax=Salinibacterium sp. ZJ454 TaxID=2708339 RepID=UPI001AB02571|nr:IclR family transcriptional regulator [Salinibacterium sp. ZJ454]